MTPTIAATEFFAEKAFENLSKKDKGIALFVFGLVIAGIGAYIYYKK